MSPEENPTTNEDDDVIDSPPADRSPIEEPVEAELAEVVDNDSNNAQASPHSSDNSVTEFFVSGSPEPVLDGSFAAAGVPKLQAPPPLAKSLQNLSANGGAIGALVLGIWCLAAAFVTNWSIINGLLGLILGFWGLSSRKQMIAWIGIAFCVAGVLLSLANISELVNNWMNVVDENSVEI